MSRDGWAAVAATVGVVVVAILGFRVLGSPASQRLAQADLRTVRALAELAQQINQRWATGTRPLPADLSKLPSALKQDPVTGKPFVYPKVNTADPWIHPRGEYCFQFQAAGQVLEIPYSY